jgi:hypothetical protein
VAAVLLPIVSDDIRRNELQAWFVAEHVVNIPLTDVKLQTGSEDSNEQGARDERATLLYR